MNIDMQKFEVDQNFDFFQRNLAKFLERHEGSYAQLKECKAIDFFETPGQAYEAGRSRFPDGIFSIQEVTDEPIDLGFFSHAGY